MVHVDFLLIFGWLVLSRFTVIVAPKIISVLIWVHWDYHCEATVLTSWQRQQQKFETKPAPKHQQPTSIITTMFDFGRVLNTTTDSRFSVLLWTFMKSDHFPWADCHPLNPVHGRFLAWASRYISDFTGVMVVQCLCVRHELYLMFSGMSVPFFPPSSKGQWAKKAISVLVYSKCVFGAPHSEPVRVAVPSHWGFSARFHSSHTL